MRPFARTLWRRWVFERVMGLLLPFLIGVAVVIWFVLRDNFEVVSTVEYLVGIAVSGGIVLALTLREALRLARAKRYFRGGSIAAGQVVSNRRFSRSTRRVSYSFEANGRVCTSGGYYVRGRMPEVGGKIWVVYDPKDPASAERFVVRA